MVKSEPQILKGNGIIKIENLGELKSNKMILSTKYNYKFDHSSSDIILEGDENIVTELKACISNGRISMVNVLDSFEILENYQDVEFMIPMVVKIGTAQFDELDIYLMDSAVPEAKEFSLSIPSNDSIMYRKINMTVQSKVPAIVEIYANELFIDTKESVQLSLQGTVLDLTLNMDQRSKCDATELSAKRAFINGQGCELKLGKLESILGYFNAGVMTYDGNSDISQFKEIHSELNKSY